MIEKGNFDVKEADIVYYRPWLDGRVLGRTKPGSLVMEVVSVCEQTGIHARRNSTIYVQPNSSTSMFVQVVYGVHVNS
jgi:hypothetical protein